MMTYLEILNMPLTEVGYSLAKALNNTFFMDNDYQKFVQLITTTFTQAIELKQSVIAQVTSMPVNLDTVAAANNNSIDLATRST